MNVEEAIKALADGKIKFDDLPDSIKMQIAAKMMNGEI